MGQDTKTERSEGAAKHTPGPWIVDAHPRRDYPRVTGARGAFVADCNEEDASLIAAAPNLMAALLEVVAVLGSNPSSICDTVWVTGNRPETLLDHCRAAIAKATGSAL